MKSVELSNVRTLLFEAAFQAGKGALAAQKNTSVLHDTGGGAGITTQADIDAQKKITSMLQAEYPAIPIVGEEGNDLTTCPEEAFIVDPIDGTASYQVGSPDWTTTIAYRGPLGSEGVIYQPYYNRMYVTNADVVEVFTPPTGTPTNLQIIEPRKPQWRISCPVVGEFSDEAWQTVLLPIISSEKVRACNNVSSNTVHFIRLFEGWEDAVIMYAKTWDSAAAIAMAERLGILVRDFQGNVPDLSIVDPQRLIFARGEEVLTLITDRTKHWPSPETELRR